MTLRHEHMGVRLGTGIGISLLLHTLLFALIFNMPRPGTETGEKHYTVKLVDIPAVTKPQPRVTGPMPEQPHAINVPEPIIRTPIFSPAPPLSGQTPQQSTRRPADLLPSLGPGAYYDAESIASTASKSDQTLMKKSQGITFDTKDMMYRGYMDMLRQKVETIWVYPYWAARQGLYGDLIIHFVILKDGRLGEVKVLRTSGHKVLDDAAVKALRDGIPYWPLPKGWDKQRLPITGRFIYSKDGGYIY